MGTIRVAIVVSEFNKDITLQMLDTAINQAQKVNVELRYICYVPGSFDMPLMIEELLKRKDIDAAITIGAIIRGETRHDNIVAENAARLIADLSLKYGKPVSLGISGPDMTIEQARDRIETVPTRAVNAAVSMTNRIRKLRREKVSNIRKTVTIED
ncbi:MAG TPA: 6,7-dimethyl-8-ribityllumazine synthase [Nitrososphaeraceae archaeon]|nr:6,7-dimethyl-8-ribityllumazine synthase [Nitrososphaeraceae archaeon]